MPKSPDHRTPKRNPTEERLRATPFESVSELDSESHTIRLNVWRKFQEAQVVNELLTKPENQFILEEWKAGLKGSFGNGSKDQLFHVYSEGRGLKLEINKVYAESLGDSQIRLVEGVIRAGVESYGSLYMRSRSLLRDSDSTIDASGIASKPKKRS